MKIALFGGSFNPPHVGHLLAMQYVLATQDVDQVWVVPTYNHAFGKDLADFDHRHAMCSALVDFFAPNQIRVSAIEKILGGESRTLRMLHHLRDMHPEHEYRLVIGSDILPQTPKWYRWEDIVQIAPPIILNRSGHPHPAASGPAIPESSSTFVRDCIARGDYEALGQFLPRPVLAYLRRNGLYGAVQEVAA